MSDELTIRGSLEESSLPELLRSITKSKESAILTCKINEQVKSIYIREGQIIFANSNNTDDRLGESLLRYGKVTVRNLLDSTNLVRPGRRLGSILCQINAITPEELVEGIRSQVRDIIMSLFEASKGNYELMLMEIDTHEMIILNMSTEDIVFDGVKSIQSWSRILKGIGSFNGKLYPSDDANKILLNVTLSGEESHLFALCERGQFTIEEICNISYLSNFETCRILWAFLMIGALETTQTTPESQADRYVPSASSIDAELDLHDLVENYNDLYSYIYEFAFQKIGEEAEDLATRAMVQVQQAMPHVAKNLRLDTYGRLDFDSILMNLRPIPEGGRMELVSSALEELIYALLYEVGSYFGPSDQKRLTLELQKLRKR
jgi:hypothetical protein